MTEILPNPNHESYAVDLGLWTGLLGPPIVWLLHFQIIYSLVGYVCEAHSHASIHIVSVLTIVITIGCGLISWKLLRPAPPSNSLTEPDETIPARPRFMAQMGLMSSALFTLVMIAQWIASFMIDPCWK